MGSSRTRDRTCVSYAGRQILYHWVTREAPRLHFLMQKWQVSEIFSQASSEFRSSWWESLENNRDKLPFPTHSQATAKQVTNCPCGQVRSLRGEQGAQSTPRSVVGLKARGPLWPVSWGGLSPISWALFPWFLPLFSGLFDSPHASAVIFIMVKTDKKNQTYFLIRRLQPHGR